jgi:hypothetical protein
MPTPSRKHSVDTQIEKKIMKEAAKPRLSASAKEGLAKKKKTPARVAMKARDKANGWKIIDPEAR